VTSPQRTEAGNEEAGAADEVAPLASDLDVEVAQAIIDDGARDAARWSHSADRQARRLETRPVLRSSTARTMRDWLSDPDILRPPAAIIPHLAVEGRVTLLSGREKVGKSTIVACAVASASRGEAVLGALVPQRVSTLWYAIDEHVADAVRRFQSLDADMDCVLLNSVPRTEDELLAALELDLAAHPEVALVVVDTLSRIFDASRLDPNSSHDVGPVISRLVDFFHGQDVAAVLLYHTGKNGREYRGSTALGATVDDILTLRRRGLADEDDFDDDASDDGRRLLVQEGRYLRGRMQLTCVGGRYKLYDDASPARTRILAALRDHGAIAGRSELSKLAVVRKATGLRLITDLIREGMILENDGLLRLAVPIETDVASEKKSSQYANPEGGSEAFQSSRTFLEGGTRPEAQQEPRVVTLPFPVPMSELHTRKKTEPDLVSIPGHCVAKGAQCSL